MKAGTLEYEAKINTDGYQKGLDRINASSITKGSLVAKGVEKIFSVVTGQIDNAMNRLDTMNQFDRVMTTITGSAEDSAEALQKVNATVKGTAYGLNVAAKSTQKFVTSGMQLDDATDQIETWANAVAFYGDGTNDTFARVTDAVSKMVASGKANMEQMNVLTDAGIPAVQIYADAVGESTADVMKDLSSGKISAQEFLSTLTGALDEGTEKFASVDGAAKQAGDSWSATFDNFNAAVSRGVSNVIKNLNDGLKEANLPGIQDMVKEAGKDIEKVLNTISDNLPKVIDLFKQFTPAIIGVTSALVGYKVALIGVQAVSIISHIMGTAQAFITLIPTITSVKDAMTLLNMTFNLNPIGLIIGAIAGLVAIFIYLWNTSEGFRNFWINLWDSFKAKVTEVVTAVTTFFQENWQNLLLLIVNPFVGAFALLYDNNEKFRAFIDGIVARIKQIFAEDIPNAINNAVAWLGQKKDEILSKIGEAINSIVTFFASLPGRIGEKLLEAFNRLTGWANDVKNKASEAGRNILNGIVDGIGDIGSKMWTIGADVINGIWEGISSKINWLGGKVASVGAGMKENFKSILGIHSPSTEFRNIAKYIPEGIAVGIDANTDEALDSVDEMAQKMSGKMKNAVSFMNGGINANADIKSNNRLFSIVQANLNIDGSVNIDGQKAGRIITPYISRTLKTGGANINGN